VPLQYLEVDWHARGILWVKLNLQSVRVKNNFDANPGLHGADLKINL
jgi:hypothetical protein